MAVTPEFIADVAEALDELGYSIENEHDVIDDVSQLDDDVTLPGIRVSSGVMGGYVSMKLAILVSYLQGRFDSVKSVWDTWFGTSSSTGVQGEWEILKVESQTATTSANNAAIAANTAATGAENVNAGLQGFTVTITDRNGTSRSVDIGFEIYRTYTSIAAMNADAANVPQGKFVVIATTDPTSEDNAKMYCKNSQGSFTFMSDLDQASSAAWADWLNNLKPQIESAITTAGQDHTQAVSDHTTASNDHSTAQDDHSTASSDHTASSAATTAATTQANRAKQWADHPPYIGDGTTGELNYWYLWNETTAQYIKGPYAKGDNLDFDSMTPEEYQRLVDDVRDSVLFASVQTCEDIIDELI